MKAIEILTKQTEDAYEWTHKLIKTVSNDKWGKTPQVVESNISWQIGHLVISIYYHSIMVIVGHQKDILETMPMREYTKLFSFDTVARNAAGRTDPGELLNNLRTIEEKSIVTINALSPEDLQSDLEPTKLPHPVAKTKFEALSWNVKHTMWHCGQIAMIKRIVDRPYDYGLRRSK